MAAAEKALADWMKAKEDAVAASAPSDESDTESDASTDAAPSDESDTDSEAPEEEVAPSDESDAESDTAKADADEAKGMYDDFLAGLDAEQISTDDPGIQSQLAKYKERMERLEAKAKSLESKPEEDVAPSEESESEPEITDEEIAEAEKEIEIVPTEAFHPEEAPEEDVAPSDESDDDSIPIDEPHAEKAPNALLEQAEAEKAKGPVDFLNFIQDHGFIPETWAKFVKGQKRSDLEYQEGGPVVADTTPQETYETAQDAIAKATVTESYETAQDAVAKALGPAEVYETPAEAIAKAQQGGAKAAEWRKFFGLPELNGSGIGSHVPPSKIMKNLWLGNSKDSQDEDFLKANKIKVVFNCTPDKPEAPGIRTIRFSIHDDPDDDMKMMKEGLAIAEQVIEEAHKHPVLVHCIEGRQRSATIMALVMGLKHPRKLSKVIQDLQKKRPIALTPEPTFKKALGRWFNT